MALAVEIKLIGLGFFKQGVGGKQQPGLFLGIGMGSGHIALMLFKYAADRDRQQAVGAARFLTQAPELRHRRAGI